MTLCVAKLLIRHTHTESLMTPDFRRKIGYVHASMVIDTHTQNDYHNPCTCTEDWILCSYFSAVKAWLTSEGTQLPASQLVTCIVTSLPYYIQALHKARQKTTQLQFWANYWVIAFWNICAHCFASLAKNQRWQSMHVDNLSDGLSIAANHFEFTCGRPCRRHIQNRVLCK